MEDNGSAARFDVLDDAVAAFRRGEFVVITDDEHRENEGDLVVAADKITPEAINFMARHGRGLICVAMEREMLARLGLSRMVPHGEGDKFRTAFMESVDARFGVSTGISAQDRAKTVSLLVSEKTTAADLVRPGHMFPLEAVEGGVLRRAGHTEATVDLARIAGVKPAGVICEILRDDGSVARMPDLVAFAAFHKLKIISVSQIAEHRRRTECLIELEEEIKFPTDLGIFQMRMYRSLIDDKRHLALIMGDPAAQDAPSVRVHSECLTGDAFGSLRCDCGSQLREAMQLIANEGHGVLLYMRQEGRGIGLEQKIHAYALQEDGLDTVEANEQLGFEPDEREYSIAAQMLLDIGVRKLKLITNNPRKISGLEDFGLQIVERVGLVLPTTIYNASYLETKKTKLGHMM